MNFLRELLFKFIAFLSTKQKPPACGYFAVIGNISVHQNDFQIIHRHRFKKLLFRPPVSVPKLCQAPITFQMAIFRRLSNRVSVSSPETVSGSDNQ
jgi:hypothetical protein